MCDAMTQSDTYTCLRLIVHYASNNAKYVPAILTLPPQLISSEEDKHFLYLLGFRSTAFMRLVKWGFTSNVVTSFPVGRLSQGRCC